MVMVMVMAAGFLWLSIKIHVRWREKIDMHLCKTSGGHGEREHIGRYWAWPQNINDRNRQGGLLQLRQPPTISNPLGEYSAILNRRYLAVHPLMAACLCMS